MEATEQSLEKTFEAPQKSTEKTLSTDRKRQNFPCGVCPFVAETKESLEKHARHHLLNPDAEFVCKKCPFYTSSRIELGLHSMVHAIQKKSLEPEIGIPEKKLKVDTEVPSLSPTQPARSRMSPFKKSVSLSPNQKHLKKPFSIGQNKDTGEDKSLSNSGDRSSPLWKVDPTLTLSPSAPNCSPPYKRKKNFKCDACPYYAYSGKDLRMHYEKHTPAPDRPLKCDMCPYYAVNNAAIMSHKRVHVLPVKESDNAELQDGDDDMSISSKTSSGSVEKKTNRQSFNTERLQCSLCPQTFTLKGNIHKHLKFHTASPSRPYKCTFCSFCCSSSGKLKVHINLHTLIKMTTATWI